VIVLPSLQPLTMASTIVKQQRKPKKPQNHSKTCSSRGEDHKVHPYRPSPSRVPGGTLYRSRHRPQPLEHNDIRASARSMTKLMTLVESKEPVPKYKGTDSPSQLRFEHLGYALIETSESKLLRSSLLSMLGNREYRFRLSTAVNMSSSAAGAINSVITVNQLQFVADFISLSAVFQEFFVTSMSVHWQPVSLYNYPLSGAIGTNVSSLPFGCASLQHNQSTYSSLSGMADNYRLAFVNSGKEFQYSWVNDELSKSTVVAASTGVVQSWCESSNVANYQGQMQFISQSAPPGLPTSQVLGAFLVEFDVLMRVRT